jgi:signal transduction histidine kinase
VAVHDARSAVLELYAALNDRDLERCGSLLDGDVRATFDGSAVTGRAAVTDRLVAAVGSTSVVVDVLAEAPDLVVVALRDPAQRWTLQTFRAVRGAITEIVEHPLPLPAPAPADQTARLQEQVALRRVAELAARDAAPREVLDAVVGEASKLVGVAFTTLLRFEPDGATEVVAIHDPPDGMTVGMRASAEGDGATQRVWRTGQAARVDRLPEMSGAWPQLAASKGYSSSAAAPIRVQDRLWGALVAAGRGRLPARIDEQLARFAQLAGTAISSASARADLEALADEQAALRRVAELVARGAEPQAVLDAVVDEASQRFGEAITALMRYGEDGFATVVAACRGPQLLGVRIPLEGRSSTADIARTGRPSRTDDYATSDAGRAARAHGIAATVSVPIVVEDAVWGSLTVASGDAPLPDGVEAGITQFADLVGTAISSTHARERLQRLADEQAALRRVAELVARGVSQQELFGSVAVEAAGLIDGFGATLVRMDAPLQWTVVATHGGPVPTGTRLTTTEDDQGLMARVARTGRRARIDDYATLGGPAWALDDFGVRSSVGVPIFLSAGLWGALGVTSPDRPLPAEAEQRLEEFAELVSTALDNAQIRADMHALADEQAALLRVAERVARGDPSDEVFSAVAAEAQRLLGGLAMTLTSFEEDAALTVVSRSGGPVPSGTRIAYEADTLPDRVRREGRAVRIDDYTAERDAALAREFGLTAAVAAPIAVEGQVWGMLTATSSDGPLAGGVEDRLQRFANLVGTAVGNATSRAQLIASRARVLSTADETRRRLQRDLHDGAQQRLVHTVITLSLAQDALAGGDVAAGAEHVAEGLRHAERANEALRELASGILPAVLTQNGLRGGVELLLDDLPMPVEACIDVPRLSPETETTAYFIIAEALTNVVKHAQARQAWVAVTLDAGAVRIEVRDDGVGGARPGEGSGLTGLFDRVEAHGGTMRVTSSVGQGTTLEARVPVGRPRPPAAW